MKKIILFLTIFLTITACQNKVVDIKSPCVSLEGGPCGPKKPINDWWLKNQNNTKTNSNSNS
ncbi:MAG: lipoprotein [Alphaproteobacteria bacterium]